MDVTRKKPMASNNSGRHPSTTSIKRQIDHGPLWPRHILDTDLRPIERHGDTGGTFGDTRDLQGLGIYIPSEKI